MFYLNCESDDIAEKCINCNDKLENITIQSEKVSSDSKTNKNIVSKFFGMFFVIFFICLLILVLFINLIYPVKITKEFETELINGNGTRALQIYDEYYLKQAENSDIMHSSATANKISNAFMEYCNNISEEIYSENDFDFQSNDYWKELINYLEEKTGTVFISGDSGESFFDFYFKNFNRTDYYACNPRPDNIDFLSDDDLNVCFNNLTYEGKITARCVSEVCCSIKSKINYFEADNSYNNAESSWDIFSASIAVDFVDSRDCFYEKAQELSERIEQVRSMMGTYYSVNNYYGLQFNPNRTCIWEQDGFFFYGTYSFNGESYILDIKGGNGYADTMFTAINEENGSIIINGGKCNNVKFLKDE